MATNQTAMHTETVGPITYRLYADQDEIEVRGNALASGDDEQDKACEGEIMRRMNDGDVWAWASVTVEASVDGTDITGTDHLGACSYRDTKEFLEGGYYGDMKNAARENLTVRLKAAAVALETLEAKQ